MRSFTTPGAFAVCASASLIAFMYRGTLYLLVGAGPTVLSSAHIFSRLKIVLAAPANILLQNWCRVLSTTVLSFKLLFAANKKGRLANFAGDASQTTPWLCLSFAICSV